MQKTFKKAFAVLLILCFIPMLPLSLSSSAESVSPSVWADAVYPQDGYGNFGSIEDMSVDEGGQIAMLEYREDGASVSVYDGAVKAYEFRESLTDPERIRLSGGRVFIYDEGNINIFTGGELVGSIELSDIKYRDFDVYGDRLFVLYKDKLKVFDLSDIGNIPEGQIAAEFAVSDGVALSVYGDTVAYLDKKRGAVPDIAILCYDLARRTTVEISGYDPMRSAEHLSVYNGYLTVNTVGGEIKVISIANKAVVATLPIENTAAQEGTVISVCALGLKGDGLYVADRFARSVQRFKFDQGAENALVYDDFYIGSFSSSVGRFNSQTDLYIYEGSKYVLDDGNRRLQILGEENRVLPFEEMDYRQRRHTAVAGTEAIYVSSETELYKLRSNGSSESIYKGTNIGALFVTLNMRLYFSDGASVYALGDGKPVTTLTETVRAIAVDLDGSTLYLATQSGITKVGGGKTGKIALSNIVDMDIDFANNLFVLTADGEVVKLNENLEEIDRKSVSGIRFSDSVTVESVRADRLALDRSSGEIYLSFKTEHAVAKLDKDAMKAATELDIPRLLPSVDILDGTANDGNTFVAKLSGWPSTIIYPFHADYAGGEVYPGGFAHTEILKVPDGTQVLVIEQIENYYYILYANKAGFVLINAVNRQNASAPPYERAQTLHSESVLYKLPTSVAKTENGASLSVYACGKLAKGTQLTLLDTVCDIKDTGGVMWYRVRCEDGTIAFIARSNVTQFSAAEIVYERSGKIRAEINQGTVQLFDRPAENILPFTELKDATVVKIIKDYHNGWLYVEGEDITGQTVRGYLKSVYVTNAPLTGAQVAGICLISSAVVLALATWIVIAAYRRRKKKLNEF